MNWYIYERVINIQQLKLCFTSLWIELGMNADRFISNRCFSYFMGRKMRKKGFTLERHRHLAYEAEQKYCNHKMIQTL